jgi:AcrR family transcriptional regulator
MSREPRLGSPGRSAAAPAASPIGGRLGARPETGQPGGGQRQPLASRPRSRDVTTADRIFGTAGRTEGPPAGTARPQRQQRPQRPSAGGGIPAQQRGLGAQGRETVRRLLDAGLAEFEETGLQATRVEDIVRRAKTSHGTFYLYFSNKDDLFRTLLQDALHDMALITDDFPVVTGNEAGRTALRSWVDRFSETYAAHATVLRILTQAEIVGEDVYADGLQQLFRLSEVMTQGMTAAQKLEGTAGGSAPAPHAELTAVACLMMLERVNYLFSAEVRMPRDEMNDRLAAIIYAAFRSP